MPGLGATPQEGGCGFDYRLAMGMPDMRFKQVRKVPDEDWSMDHIFHELTNRRSDERVICYVESHDQALVGDKTMIFELLDSAMYHDMHIESNSIVVDRGIALHKMIRLATLASAGHGYLTFMGNEFGHPEWIDFPREGNNWSYHYARRQWSLAENPDLRYRFLGEWDKAIVHLLRDHGLPNGGYPECRWSHDDDKVLAFERANFVFVFNFHASLSHVDYAIELPAGTYKLLMCSDDREFGGKSRVEALQTYRTVPRSPEEPSRHVVRLYLPARTSIVLLRS